MQGCGPYEKRLQAAYPIHPEIFDRLYNDWSTLVKFQRTRGVLRLMAAVIHSLWEKGDRTPLILPSTIPIDDQRVQFELTRYLSDNWVPGHSKRTWTAPTRSRFASMAKCRTMASSMPAAVSRGRSIWVRRADGQEAWPPSRHRGPAREARVRDAGRDAGRVR